MHYDCLCDNRISDPDWRSRFVSDYLKGRGFDDLFYYQCFGGDLLPTPSSLEMAAKVYDRLDRLAGDKVVAVEVGELGRPFLKGKEASSAVKKTLLRKGGAGGLKAMTHLSRHPELLAGATVQIWHICNGGSLIRLRYEGMMDSDWGDFTATTGIKVKYAKPTPHGYYYNIVLA